MAVASHCAEVHAVVFSLHSKEIEERATNSTAAPDRLGMCQDETEEWWDGENLAEKVQA